MTTEARFGDQPRPSDQELVQRARLDPERFLDLYDRYAFPVYSYFVYGLGKEKIAQVATSATFTRAQRNFDNFQPEVHISFRAWLFGIAYNEAQQAQGAATWSDISNHGGPEHAETRKSVANLDNREKHIVLLNFTAGLTLEETARVLGEEDPEVISQQLTQALAKLQESRKG